MPNERDLSPLAFLVAATLERYQASCDRLVEAWFDRSVCRIVNDELSQLQNLIAALPQLSADMMEVLMRHAQLLRSLLRCERPNPHAPMEVAALRTKHRSAVDAMHTKCLRLLEAN